MSRPTDGPRDPRTTAMVATPYREGSCSAITGALQRRGMLRAYVSSCLPIDTNDSLKSHRAIGLTRTVMGTLKKRVPEGIEPENLASVWTAAECAHLISRRLTSIPELTSRLMYRAKVRFDARVARRLHSDPFPPDVIIGMYGSSARTFAIAKHRGLGTVLNFVNSHPTVQNTLLQTYAALDDSHHELISPSIARAVEEEIGSADLILSPSTFVTDQLRSMCGVQEESVLTIPYGVDNSRFAPMQGVSSVAGEPLRILFVGQVGYRKGVPTLIDAARRLQGIAVIDVVGPISSRGVLRELPPNVHYRGTMDSSLLPSLMALADLLAVPSYEDAYPLVVLEAMACGTPAVITTNVGSKDAIEDGLTGFVIPPGDPDALVKTIAGLYNEPERLRVVANAVRAASGQQWSWNSYGDSVVDALIDSYRR